MRKELSPLQQSQVEWLQGSASMMQIDAISNWTERRKGQIKVVRTNRMVVARVDFCEAVS
jgi:hypothetical protein